MDCQNTIIVQMGLEMRKTYTCHNACFKSTITAMWYTAEYNARYTYKQQFMTLWYF